MFATPKTHLAAAILSVAMLAPEASLAGPFDSDRMVIVTTDGRLMRDIPEAGSVRIVIDTQGRRLVIDQWNTVIGFEVPASQVYQRPQSVRRSDNRLERSPSAGARVRLDQFPSAPPPPPLPPEDEFANAEPSARIERRDLNPTTGTVPARRRDSSIIEIPTRKKPTASVEPLSPIQPLSPEQPKQTAKLTKAQVAALQVYLDRKGFSPGVIDGRMGSNVRKALSAYQEATGEQLDPSDTDLIMSRLATGGSLAFTTYTITAEDAAGPYIASVPSDYAHKAKLERLSFTSPLEMLAERFHMDEDYLKELNPGVDFDRPGVEIKVAAPAEEKTGVVSRIIADKGLKQLRGYDASGKLLVAYPATIGSADTPSPTGEVTIERIAKNPGYTYNPKINFTQGNNTEILQVPPGPNGPVGSMWIALSKPTYGIHGTPEPSKIGKTASHGCVRLTNWDAGELAGLVAPGVSVSFVD